VEELPSFKAYKKLSFDRLNLKPGDTVVDVGFGLGFDVAKTETSGRAGGL